MDLTVYSLSTRKLPFLLESAMFDRKAWQENYNEQHKEEIREYHKRWYRVPENKRKFKLRGQSPEKKEYNKLYRQKNKKYLNEYAKQWKQSPEGILARKKYQQSLKAKTCRKRFLQSPRGKLHKKIYGTKRYSKTRDLTFTIIQQVYEDNIKLYGTLTCYLCLEPIIFGNDHLEHKIPLSRGGTNKRYNLDVSCKGCNCKKSTRTETEYRKELLSK